jgi:hypothetical protein
VEYVCRCVGNNWRCGIIQSVNASGQKIKTTTLATTKDANGTFNKALERSLQHTLYDFEDHANSCGKHDFRNVDLLALIKKI